MQMPEQDSREGAKQQRRGDGPVSVSRCSRMGRADSRRRERTPRREGDSMNILTWHVHGAWATAFVQGDHRYLIPTLPDVSIDIPFDGGTPAGPANILSLLLIPSNLKSALLLAAGPAIVNPVSPFGEPIATW